MSSLPTMIATVLRGLRSRALLSAGCILLTALAIGSAVLAPIFQAAVTNSYLITRLNDAPNPLTGLTWTYQTHASSTDSPAEVRDRAARIVRDRAPDQFTEPSAQLQTRRVMVGAPVVGEVRLLAKQGACDHVEIVRGRCPTAPGEMMVLVGDLERDRLEIGEAADLDGLGERTVVGGYRVPETEEDYWFQPLRMISTPATENPDGSVVPYRPAPFIVPDAAFESLATADWEVLVDRRLEVPADLTLTDLDQARAAAAGLTEDPVEVEGGTLRGFLISDLDAIAAEAREQQATARSSIAPAVLSLVLVALALLLRLLMAAADLRLPELALASLRGLTRRRMWSLGLSEPIALLALSVPIGGAFGVGLALALVRGWLVPGLPLPLPGVALVTGLGVALAVVAVAFLAVGLVLRVSLSEQLTGVRRPQTSGRLSVILQLGLVAVAGAVLASKVTTTKPGDPDVTDLILPVLLAVVGGLAATRATSWLASWWTQRRVRTRSLPAFVAARAISRRQEGTLVILPVTAAIAVCVFGAGVYDSAAAWRTSVAATTAPAAQVWTSPAGISATVALTERLDPDGDWLMAGTTISTLGPTYSVLDTRRLARVSEWQDQWTPGIGPEEVAEALSPRGAIPVVTGRRVGITVDNRAEVAGNLHVRLRFDVRDNRPRYLYLGPFPAGKSTQEGPVPFCRAGCRFDGLTLGGAAATPVAMTGEVAISDVTVDGGSRPDAVEGAGWGAAFDTSGAAMIADVTDRDGVLDVTVSTGDSAAILHLAAGGIPEDLPVVRGVDAPPSPADNSSTSSTEFTSDPVVRSESVPLLGPTGLLIDYSMLTANRQIPTQPTAPVYVLARGDTPEAVIEQLQDEGATLTTTLERVRATLDQSGYALALRLYALVAVLVLLMALAGLFVSSAVQLPSRRRDAASLRVVGVPRRSVVSAVVRELGVVLGGTAIAGLAAGTLAQYVVLRTVTLGVVDDVTTPALVAAVDGQRLALLAVAAAALLGAVALLSAALTVRGARGATLRENAR